VSSSAPGAAERQWRTTAKLTAVVEDLCDGIDAYFNIDHCVRIIIEYQCGFQAVR